MIIKTSISGRKPSKKQKEKQKAAWKDWCNKYGLNKRDEPVATAAPGPRINKFGQIERY